MKTKNKIQGIATMLWFNQTKGFGEVRFLANQSTAIIFAKDLPDSIKNNPLNDSKKFSLKCVAILHEEDKRLNLNMN